MFDINKIGKKISVLRKQSGLTQMELADRLGISFQAVSNWERGNTMPDISKLPELAEIFGVSIETILGDGHKAKVVQDIAEGQTPADIKAEDLADIAPIVSNEQFKQAYEQVETDGDGMDFGTIMSIVPFLDEDVVGDFVKNYAKHGLTMSQAHSLAPFCGEDILDEVADGLITDGASINDLSSLVPFLGERTISKIVKQYLNKGICIYDLVCVAPFMDEDDVAEMVSQYVAETNDVTRLKEFAPFMDEDNITDIAAGYVKRGGKINDLMSVAPFMDMNALFKHICKN